MISEIPNFYAEATFGEEASSKINYLKQVYEGAPHFTEITPGKDVKWETRTKFHKLARLILKFSRFCYVTFFFYMVPYSTFVLCQFGKTYFVWPTPAAGAAVV